MRLNPKGVVVGFDFTFGHRAQGTAKTLRELSRGRYQLAEVEPGDVGRGKSKQYIGAGDASRRKFGTGRPLVGAAYRMEGKW